MTYKTYSMLSAGRFASDMRDALAKGYVSKAPSFNSVFDYLQMASLTPYLKQLIAESAMPLQSIEDSFAVDSSGFSTTSYVRWFDVKYGNNEDWHDWLKMHLMCRVKTHIVTSVEMSGATANDSPYFKPLLQRTAKAGFTMKEVSADKGYISMKNLQTTVDHGAVPFIPFKANAQTDRGTDVWSKMFFFYNYKREEFLAHYHKRSNVESVFQMIKSKFGERLRSKTETAPLTPHSCKAYCSRVPPFHVNLNRSRLLTTKENNMLKRLTRKLITLSVLVFTLAAVSFTPASSKNQQLYCYYDIVTAECPTGWICCDDTTGKNCWCA